jgi:hypothetical protein
MIFRFASAHRVFIASDAIEVAYLTMSYNGTDEKVRMASVE